MRPPESFIGQPIRSLQTMLRLIAEDAPGHVRVIPDGIYGPETMQAVAAFQRIHGLSATGVTVVRSVLLLSISATISFSPAPNGPVMTISFVFAVPCL